MTRRELLRTFVLTGTAALLEPRAAGGQRPQPPAPGDRLYDPSVVQQRAVVTAADNDPVVKTLEQSLKCSCGCNLDIYTCRTTDFTCTYSPELHREVLSLREAGKSSDEVVAAFVAKYGEQILMAPKPEGFNLAGYLVPGAAVLTAGVLLVAVLRRRGRRALPPVAIGLVPPLPAGAADAERLRRALADVED